MGAIADLTAYLAAFGSTARHIAMIKAVAGANDVNCVSSLWRSIGKPDQGAIPSTAAVPDRTTVGTFQQPNPGGGNEQFLSMWQLQAQARATIIIADRLSHQGGLSGIVTGAQTTNLPTSALTRYTSGDGVFAAIEIYTQIGTTATTVTMSYTNQAGTSGQTSQPVVLGGTNRREVSKLIPMSLASGDTGVQAVASVNVVATTGTAGNFGVTLYKPLLMLPCLSESAFWSSGDPIQRLGGFLPKIPNDAALWPLIWAPSNCISLANLKFLEA